MKGSYFGGLLSVLFSFLTVSLASTDAFSATLNVFFNDPQVSDVDLVTGRLSAPIPIGVFNEDANDAPEDFLTAWQLSLAIVPEAGATGSLSFVSPVVPTASEPPNYLLDGINSTIIVSENLGNSLLAFDFSLTGGRQVPIEPGANLLQIELQSSSDASGTFGIYALGGQGESEWSDATPLPIGPSVRQFANLPTGQILLGTVNVDVPEPSSFLLFAVSIFVICLFKGCFPNSHHAYKHSQAGATRIS